VGQDREKSILMRATVQRVHEASVTVDGTVVGSIGQGLLVYTGVAADDAEDDARYLAEKIAGLRIFIDDEGKMNRCVSDIGGGVLVVSAFTLQADARKGRRPSFDAAAGLDLANSLYERLCEMLAGMGLPVARGVFRAHMEVASINDGPICILLDSKRLF
jgi:D-aminoacyl-tRNA deacylase